MKQDYNITIDSMGKRRGEELINKLKKLKPKFEKLNYAEKLKFWENNGLELLTTTYFFEGGEHRNEPKNHISISPKKEEYQLYFDWYFENIKIFHPLEYDIDKMKEHYHETIKDNLQAINYTISQIRNHQKKRQGINSIAENSFQRGFNSYMNKKKIIFEDKDFTYQNTTALIYGLIYAQFIPFLENQLIIFANQRKNMNDESENEILPDEIQQRIAWLYSIGIIDYIKEKHKTHSSSTIGRILSKGTGGSWDAIRKTIDRIEKENLLEKYNGYINQTCQQLKISRVK